MTRKNILKKILKPKEKIIKEFSLGKRYILFIQTITTIVCLIFLPISWIISPLFFFFVIVLISFLVIFVGWYLRRANIYLLTDKRILIHRGWLSTQLISVDYEKITDIKVFETFVEKIFLETGAIFINTAGTPYHEIKLLHIKKPYNLKKKIDQTRESLVRKM